MDVSKRSRRRYDPRHDEVLREVATYLSGHLSAADYQMVADLDSYTYTFPTHICPTTERSFSYLLRLTSVE